MELRAVAHQLSALLARQQTLGGRSALAQQPVYQRKRHKEPSMRIAFSLAIMTLLAAVPLLSACHAVEGAGQDISSTGRTVQRHM